MWDKLAEKALQGLPLTKEEGLAILRADDTETLKIVDAAWRVRREYFADKVKVNVLSNAKSGMCAEDCHYCSQSQKADAPTQHYSLLKADDIFLQAEQAKKAGGRRFCITMAVRSASWSAVDSLAEATKKIKSELGLEVCACLGLMTGDVGRQKLKALKDAGVDSYNHNLNTHKDIYPSICTTHTYEDRLETIRNAQEAGFSTCSGLIVGMGESDEQLVELALTFRAEKMNSIPVNFLIPVQGTPIHKRQTTTAFTPWKCLRYLSLFRLTNPTAEIRASAGRELHIRSLQPLALLVANSIFLGGYLTQDGAPESEDWNMIRDLGLEPIEWSAPFSTLDLGTENTSPEEALV